MGTVLYMSPEQLRGEAVDSRSDLWSFGVVAYELLAGVSPFQAHSGAASAMRILSEEPPALASVPGVPDWLAELVNQLLQKAPGQRPQSASEVLSRLVHPSSSSHSKLERQLTVWRRRAVTPRRTLIVASVIILMSILGALVHRQRSQKVTEKDTLVLADFKNTTGDAVFDDALKRALSVQLDQSPFLNVASDVKMASTLRMMGREKEERLTEDVAREACQRSGSKAMVSGSIAPLGNQYLMGLEVVNCFTGDKLAQEQVQVATKEEVLKALGTVATALRAKLGESLPSIQKFDAPLEEATTASLDALKAFSMGMKASSDKGSPAAIPFFKRAIELDPNFASAWAHLGAVYYSHLQANAASENVKRAFELRARVSEREKYFISSFYYASVTGEIDKASQTCELWAQSYPRDVRPRSYLGYHYMMLGQVEKALEESQQALRLEPDFVNNYVNLAWSYFGLNRLDDAKAIFEKALARKLDAGYLHAGLYFLAFARRDDEQMKRQVAWSVGKRGEEDLLLAAQANTEAYYGRLAKARELSRRSVELALNNEAKESAALWQAIAALREANFGNTAEARQLAQGALGIGPDIKGKVLTALALARVGDAAEAQAIANDLRKDLPLNTLLSYYWLPAIYGAIEIRGNNSAKAIDILEARTPYEDNAPIPFIRHVVRGEAYLQARRGKEAAAEFEKILHPPEQNFHTFVLARLGLGRAYAIQGDRARSRAAYQDFLTLWKDADPNIPIFQQAKAEYARLE
jgi:tetratricopeptide (TPR) repeat protein